MFCRIVSLFDTRKVTDTDDTVYSIVGVLPVLVNHHVCSRFLLFIIYLIYFILFCFYYFIVYFIILSLFLESHNYIVLVLDVQTSQT